jgi:hypothetical protein
MTRDDAVLFLSEQWPSLASALGVGAFDTAPGGWKGALDSALRSLGTARADLTAATVSTPDEAKFEALLRYFGARLLLAEATSKVDISVTGTAGISKRNSQMADALRSLLALYTEDLAVYGIAVGPQMTAGRFGLDFLEPAAAEWGA